MMDQILAVIGFVLTVLGMTVSVLYVNNTFKNRRALYTGTGLIVLGVALILWRF